MTDGMKISSSFPGGNIVVEKIESDTVYLHPDLRDTEGEWFYWYFEVTGAQSRTVRFQFSGCRALAARGPAVQTGNRGWSWLGADSVRENSFTYTFGPNENATRFCMTFPYTQTQWDEFLHQLREEGHTLKAETLCRSRAGRPVEFLRLGNTGTPEHRVVVTARHHACETMASFALEGIVRFILSPDGRGLREKAEILFVPFVDRDGAETGDQGKFRRPRDHNRDYIGQSLYPETAALRELLPKWTGGKLRLALDLHCPWIADGINEKLYIVGSRHARIWEEQQRLAEILERTKTGPLPFLAADSLPFGQGWNNAASYQAGRSFGDWVTDLPEVQVAGSLEVPYANASGGEVNVVTARAFGADLGRSLALYLE